MQSEKKSTPKGARFVETKGKEDPSSGKLRLHKRVSHQVCKRLDLEAELVVLV